MYGRFAWRLVLAAALLGGFSGAVANGQTPPGTRTYTDPATGQTYIVPDDGRSYHADGTGRLLATQTGNSVQSSGHSGSTAGMRFQLWRDPAEGAFTVALPQGWQIGGGTQRTTQIEPHYVIRAQSPTGGVQIFFDDPHIAMREVPNAMTARMGWREGQLIPASAGVRLLLQRYEPAPQAAVDYVRRAVCSSATNFRGGLIPGESEESNREFEPIAQAEGKRIHADAGELAFDCGRQKGYVYAVTLQAWQQGGMVSMWIIYRMAGFVTTPEENTMAADAMHTLLKTFQLNQQWLQNFARECNDVTGNVIRESNAITQASMDRAKQMDAQEQQQFAAWRKNSDATYNAIEHGERQRMESPGGNGNGHDYNPQLGQKTVCNSVNTCQTVDASVTNWWFDCAGKAHPGSESGDAPSGSLSACWDKGH